MAKKRLNGSTRRKRRIPLIAVLAVIAGLAYAGYVFFVKEDRESARVRIGSEEFTLEIARTAAARAAGLSNRQSLGASDGMLFVYGVPSDVNFWMKDTAIPLTAAYMDENGTILELYDLQPLSEDGVPSKQPVRYVIELNQGAFARAGADVGDTVESITGGEKYGLGF